MKILWVAPLGLFILAASPNWTTTEGNQPGPGSILTSPNGVTWTKRLSCTIPSCVSVAWSGSLLVAVGGGYQTTQTVATSTDGINWTPRGTPMGSNPSGFFSVGGICWNSTSNVWAALASNAAYTSTNGITWTFRGFPFTGPVPGASDLEWVPPLGLYIAAGTNNNQTPVTSTVATSPNAITWTSRGNPFSPTQHVGSHAGSITWISELSLAVLTGGFGSFSQFDFQNLAFSTNGTTWTTKPLDNTGFYFGLDCVYSPTLGRLVLVGSGQSEPQNTTWAWDDATTRWKKLSPATTGPRTSAGKMVHAAGIGAFLIFTGYSGTPFTSPYVLNIWRWNGTNWHNMDPSGMPEMLGNAWAVTWDGANLIVNMQNPSGPVYSRTYLYNYNSNTVTLVDQNSIGQMDIDEFANEPTMVWTGDRAIMLFDDGPYDYQETNNTFTVHTWKYTPTTWTEMHPPAEPTGFDGGFRESVQHFLMMYDGARVLAYDPERGLVWRYDDLVKTHIVNIVHRV